MLHEELLKATLDNNASDLHVSVGSPPAIRKDGKLVKLGTEKITSEDSINFVKGILATDKLDEFLDKGDLDFTYALKGVGRFRINVFRQRGTFSIAARLVALKIPNLDELGLPSVIKELTTRTKGLILVTGPTGSGKSTTLASMIDVINEERQCHILTLEDPVEYLHRHKNSIVNQREIGSDSKSYAAALKSALREDPDVILVGEMRDIETIAIAVTAAETGHLVFSTLHTIGAAKTIDRIIDVFPPYQQQQIRIQLASVLQAVISQQLLPRTDRPGRVSAIEIMVATPAIRNLIREGKSHQIDSLIQTGAKSGMQAMDSALATLYAKRIVGYDDVMARASSYENITRYMAER